MTPSTLKDLRIAIVGGGVCGLTCAIALAKYGISAQLYEAAEKFGEIGAGIGIGPNALRILHEIGVADSVLATTDGSGPIRMGWLQFRSGMQDSELIYDYNTSFDQSSIGIHRAAFLDALVHHVDLKSCHFKKRCVRISETLPSVEANSKYVIHFADGTTAEADVVFGADGIKSAVRRAVTGVDSAEHVTFSGTICYRGLVPTEKAKAAGLQLDLIEHAACFVGQGKHLIVFAVKGGQIINVVAFACNRDIPLGEARLSPGEPSVVAVTKEQLLKEYEGWGSDVLALLTCIEKPDKWYISIVHPPLKSYVRGGVALLGDAAHAMLPHLGAGAGQAIEDAYLLAKLLSHPQLTNQNVEMVLQVYDEIRRPRAQSVWEGSIRAGDIYEGYGISGSSPEGMRKDLEGIADFVWEHDLNQDMQQATIRLQQLGIFVNETS